MKRILTISLSLVMLIGCLTGCGADSSEIKTDEIHTDIKHSLEVSEDLEMVEHSYGWVVAGIGICSDENIVIPSEHEGKQVVAICDNAFEDNEDIKTVFIPETIKVIGDSAFLNCDNLERLTISEGVETIKEYAFCGCDILTEITIPGSVEIIEKKAFAECEELTSVEIKDGVKTIEKEVFISDSELKDLTIPKSVESMSDSALNWCHDLTEIYYEGTVDQWCELIGENLITESDVTIHCSDGDHYDPDEPEGYIHELPSGLY